MFSISSLLNPAPEDAPRPTSAPVIPPAPPLSSPFPSATNNRPRASTSSNALSGDAFCFSLPVIPRAIAPLPSRPLSAPNKRLRVSASKSVFSEDVFRFPAPVISPAAAAPLSSRSLSAPGNRTRASTSSNALSEDGFRFSVPVIPPAAAPLSSRSLSPPDNRQRASTSSNALSEDGFRLSASVIPPAAAPLSSRSLSATDNRPRASTSSNTLSADGFRLSAPVIPPVAAPLSSRSLSAASPSRHSRASASSATRIGAGPDPGVQSPDWKQYTHMDGRIYYACGQLLTRENYIKPRVQEALKAAYKTLSAAQNGPEGSRIEAIVSLAPGPDGAARTSFASLSTARMYVLQDDRFVVDDSQSFWKYVADFSMHRRSVPLWMETDFLEALAFGSNQRVMDVQNTTFPFDDSQIERLMRVYRDLRGSRNSPIVSQLAPALCYHIAEVMYVVSAARVRYRHGTADARRYRDVAIPEPTLGLRIWDLFLGILLCGAHTSYRTRLYSTAPKGYISLPEFRKLMRELLSEWADSNLVATVLVSVNVGFLAVPNLTGTARSSSLVSSIFAMTSIITGLHHVWQHRQKTDAEFDEVKRYLNHVRVLCGGSRAESQLKELTTFEITPTACFLALPLATLQWSVLSFTLAISVYALHSSSHGPGVELFVVLLVILGVLSCGAFLYFYSIWMPVVHKEQEEGRNPNLVCPPEVRRSMGVGVAWKQAKAWGRQWVSMGQGKGQAG